MSQPGDLDQVKAQIEQMTVANDAGCRRVAQTGVQINIDGIRGMALVEHLLGDWNDPRRLAYELYVQQKFTVAIADVEEQIASQMARARLLQGVNGAQVPGPDPMKPADLDAAASLPWR